MVKKKRKVRTTRRFMAFLAAVCMVGAMPGMPAVSYAEERMEESLEMEDAGADGQEVYVENSGAKEQSDGSEQGEEKTGQEEGSAENAGEETKNQEADEENGAEAPADREDTEESQDQENDGENSGENGGPKPEETDGTGNPEEETTENEMPPLEDGEEEPEENDIEKDTVGTVSENTIHTDGEEAVSTEGNAAQQINRAGKSFQIDGKTYNSEDADQTYTAGDDITAYYFEPDSLLYFDGTGPMNDWHIAPRNPWYHIKPDRSVVGEGITAIGVNAFYWPDHSLKSVSLPDTLETISKNGFYQCYDMEEVLLPEGLKSIGESAFLGCRSLTSIDIPESVTDLGESAFYECKSAAFIHVPGSIKEVKSMAFASCEAAKTITIDEGVESIGRAAFQSSKISELTLPQSVTMIGEWAFASSKNLHTLTIPDSVTEIGDRAFVHCSALLNIHIGTGVTTIGTNAFQVSAEKKFRLFSENETAWAYDWTGDRRVISCQITFMDTDGAPLQSSFVGMGEKILPYAPEMEGYSTKEETFTFAGWEPEITEETEAAGDVEYTPVYQSAPRTYHVLFKDFDETVISDLELAYGTDIYEAQPDTLKREPDAQYSYTFSGWTPALAEGAKVEGEAAYTASYTSEKRKYTITFLNYDGSTIKKVEKPYGTVIADEAPTPAREPEGGHTYEFKGWQPALDEEDILTADAVYEAVYTSDQRECSVVFQDYDGSVLKTCRVPYGETISGKVPEASRKDEGLSSYTFVGWQPALDTEAPILGDITYTALYTRKTQTGIYVAHDINYPSGSGIGAADIRVYPVYEIYDTDGELQEEMMDRLHPVDQADIRLSPDKVEKGDNVICVEQISTGCTSDMDIYGSFIDGISATPVDTEVKTGTEVEKVYVYFTRNQKGTDGEIQQGVVQKKEPVERYTLNDGTSPVIVVEGDNQIKITEKETGEEYSCTIHVTGVGKGDSGDGDGEKEPDSGDGDDEKELDDGDGDDGKEPDDGDGDDGKEPDDGDGDDGKEPDDGDGNDGKEPDDGDGDNGKKPDDDGKGGEKDDGDDGQPGEDSDGDGGSGSQPDTEQADGERKPEPIPEIPDEINLLVQDIQPQAVQEKKPVFPVPEISEESIQPEEKSGQTEETAQQEPTQETEIEEKEHQHMPLWPWLLSFGTGTFGIWLWLFGHRKRMVRGTVLYGDGNAVCGIKASLMGAEDEVMEVQTDEDGQYLFDALEKNDYRLCLYDKKETVTLLMDIRMSTRDRKKVFSIHKSAAENVETRKRGKKYQIDVTV